MLLDRCLIALTAAIAPLEAAGVRCVPRIVLDACTDDSAAIVARHGIPAIQIDDECVGAARAAGIASALDEVGHDPTRARVDREHRRRFRGAALLADRAARGGPARGAAVFVGTVRPDFADLSRRHQRLWHATHTPGLPNGHVHGASLGVRADVYLAAGGFDPVREHEDVSLVDRCRQLGAVVVASDEAEVITSGRTVGRTPGGYAGYLREQARELARD